MATANENASLTSVTSTVGSKDTFSSFSSTTTSASEGNKDFEHLKTKGSSEEYHDLPALVGVGRPLGVLPAYCEHSQAVALHVHAHKGSITGNDYTIKDMATGEKVFEVEGPISMHSKRHFKDAHDKPLFTLVRQLSKILPTYEAVEKDEKNSRSLFTVKIKLSMGTDLRISFANSAGSGEEVEFRVKGKWSGRRMVISLEDGTPIAHMTRDPHTVAKLVWDTQDYCITAAPGVDTALMAAIAVCCDEAQNPLRHC